MAEKLSIPILEEIRKIHEAAEKARKKAHYLNRIAKELRDEHFMVIGLEKEVEKWKREASDSELPILERLKSAYEKYVSEIYNQIRNVANESVLLASDFFGLDKN